MEKENQRIAITKRLLKESLLELLDEKDMGKISITELCQKAEINRATFYRHYNVPQDVLIDIELDLIEKSQNVAPLPKTLKSALPYLENLFTYIYENADIVRTLIKANTDNNLVHILDKCNYSILENKVHMTDGSTYDKDSLKLLSAYLGGGGYFLVRAWLTDDVHKTPKEIAQLIYEHICRDLETYVIG